MMNNTPNYGQPEINSQNSALDYLTKADVAKLFKVTTRTIDAWMARRLLPYFKIGRTVRFTSTGIEEFINTNCRVAGRSICASSL
jgi:excisionase family DNA binding protein